MRPSKYNIGDRKTVRGYRFDECSSAMQKAIRRGDVTVAGFFAIELVMSNYAEYVWKRLLTVSAEDCWGCITQETEALYQAWKRFKKSDHPKAGRIFVSKAVILLAHVAKHNRDADLMNNLVYDANKISAESVKEALEQAERNPQDVPEYALDCHTAKGKASGKTKTAFFKEEQLALFNEHASIL